MNIIYIFIIGIALCIILLSIIIIILVLSFCLYPVPHSHAMGFTLSPLSVPTACVLSSYIIINMKTICPLNNVCIILTMIIISVGNKNYHCTSLKGSPNTHQKNAKCFFHYLFCSCFTLVALKLLVSRLVACSPRIVPDTQTHRTTTVTLAAHARRGLTRPCGTEAVGIAHKPPRSL